MQIEDIIDRYGGVATTAELAQHGIRRRELERMLEERRAVRAYQGHYVRARINDDLLRAVRVGGRATASTALRRARVWCVDHRLHVSVRPTDSRLRRPDDKRQRLAAADRVCVHWDDDRDAGSGRASRLRRDPLDSLVDLASCATVEHLTLTADSLLHRFPRVLDRWDLVASRFPRDVRRRLARLDGICESGTETLFWLRMRDRLALRRQVEMPGVGRVDFLIGRRLIVEIDGAEFHADPSSFERDRRRDAALSARGYRVLRFSYGQVMNDWPSVEAAVVAAVLRGDHL